MSVMRRMVRVVGQLHDDLLAPRSPMGRPGASGSIRFAVLFSLPVLLSAIFLYGGPLMIELDSYAYLQDAIAFLNRGASNMVLPAYRSIGYPAFLAWVIEVFTVNSVFGLKLCQHLLLLLMRLMLFLTAYNLTGSKTYAAIVLFINCTLLSTLVYANNVMTETLYSFFIVATVWMVSLTFRRPRPFLYVLGGIAASVASAWVKPQAKLLWVLVLVATAPALFRFTHGKLERSNVRRLLATAGMVFCSACMAWALMLPMKISPPLLSPEAAQLAAQHNWAPPSPAKMFFALGLWSRFYDLEQANLAGPGTAEFFKSVEQYLGSHPTMRGNVWRLPLVAMDILMVSQGRSPRQAIDWMYDNTMQYAFASPYQFLKNSLLWVFWDSVTTGGDLPHVLEQSRFAAVFTASRDARAMYERLWPTSAAFEAFPASQYFRIFEETSPKWITWAYLTVYMSLYKLRNAVLFLFFLGPGLLLAFSSKNRTRYLAPLLFYLYHIAIWPVMPQYRYYIPVDGMANLFHGLAAIAYLDLLRGRLWPRVARLWRQVG